MTAVLLVLLSGLLAAQALDLPTISSTVATTNISMGGDWLLAWHDSQIELIHKQSQSVVWSTKANTGFVSAAVVEETPKDAAAGNLMLKTKVVHSCMKHTVNAVTAGSNSSSAVVTGAFLGEGCSPATFSLEFARIDANQVSFELHLKGTTTATPTTLNWSYLYYTSEADERLWGFGEQYTHLDATGQVIPINTREQGVGRGLEPITFALNTFGQGAGGNEYTTYSAMAQYVTSRRRGLLLDTFRYSEFDCSDVSAQVVRFAISSRDTLGRVLRGDSLLHLISVVTSVIGRQAALPDFYTHGAVVGLQGGTAVVQQRVDAMLAAGVALTGVWVQDWSGTRNQTVAGKIQQRLWWNWEVDDSHYPHWTNLTAHLASQGVAMTTYINPFLCDVSSKASYRHNYFKMAAEQGFLVKNASGLPYLTESGPGWTAGTIDLTNADAVSFFVDMMTENMVRTSTVGWMADYGEYLPYDAVLASGEPASTYHNAFPEAWARLNRRVSDAAATPTAFFSRSASLRSPGVSTLFWQGDQLPSWDVHDGLTSVVVSLLGSGFSGMALQHSDTGGFTTVDEYGERFFRSAELLRRWTELSAFTTVMRTHEGSQPDKNVQVYTNADTLAHFARFSTVFARLAAYRLTLIDEATTLGYPVVRHLALHYEDDPAVFTLDRQFLFGARVLVAPVLAADATTVDAYLPKGDWIHVWSHNVTHSLQGVWLSDFPAPLGQPAVWTTDPAIAALFKDL